MNETNPSQQNVTHVHVEQSPSNGMGLAGFIVSLAGWVTCGVLCPIGFILSLIGLRKEPRGFAIAGVIVGLIGSIFLLVIGLGIVLSFLGLGAAAVSITALTQMSALQFQATESVNAFYAENARLPSITEFSSLVTPSDLENIRYEIISENEFKLTFPGFDGQFDTADDSEVEQSVVAPSSSITP